MSTQDRQFEAIAEALLNARAMRRGAPSVTGIRHLVPAQIWEDALEDARVAVNTFLEVTA